jgi:hypothetical protein
VTEISENARVIVLLADFANQDPANKINLLGAHWNITGVQPNGATFPQAVVIFVELPPRFKGKDFTLSVALLDEAGNPVDEPSPTGERQPLRLQQAFRLEQPGLPEADMPPDVPARIQAVLNFPIGIPLATNKQYRWHVEIDDTAKPEWDANFYVVGPPSGSKSPQE